MTGQTGELILLTVALLLSAFFSGSETAYTTAGRLAMEVFGRHRRRGSGAARYLYDKPRLLFSTTLVGNNLVGVAYSSLAALVLARLGVPLEWIVLIASVVVLLFGEILPKSIAREMPERWAMTAGWPLRASHVVLYPLILLARAASEVVLFLFGMRGDEEGATKLSVSELRGIWHDLRRSGQLDVEEAKLLDQAVTLREKKIGELMVPRTAIAALPAGASVEEAERLVQARGFSRIPVFEEDIDHVIGILHAKSLLSRPEHLRDVLMPPLIVPEQATVPSFLALSRKHEAAMGIVVDEHGGTAGLITQEDVVEEIVGDIQDEHDRQSDPIRHVSSGAYLVHGLTSLDDLEGALGVKLPEGEYETVGGLMIERSGEIPKLGHSEVIGPWTLRVVAADRHRVKRVLIRKNSRHG